MSDVVEKWINKGWLLNQHCDPTNLLACWLHYK